MSGNEFKQSIVEDLTSIANILDNLLTRIETIESDVRFYGHSINNLEMLVKALSDKNSGHKKDAS